MVVHLWRSTSQIWKHIEVALHPLPFSLCYASLFVLFCCCHDEMVTCENHELLIWKHTEAVGSSLFLVLRFILWPCDVVIHCASFLYWSWLKLLITIIGNTLEQCWWTLVGTHYYRVGYASWELVNRQLGLVLTGHQLTAYVTIVRRAESHTRTKISWNIDALNKHLSVAKHSRLTP